MHKQSEKVSSKRPYPVWFHLYDILEKAKCTDGKYIHGFQ